MNVFQLIKTVLDDEYAEIPGSDVNKDAQVQKRLKDLSNDYGSLAIRPPCMDYGDPVTRLAYIFRYVTCHTHLVASEAISSDEIQELLDRDRLSVACVGGGPGSDFLGLLKCMMDAEKTGTLRCYLLDGETGWGDAWTDVGEQLAEMPFTVFTHFQQLDVADSSTWLKQRKYLKADLFTMVYFVSEVFTNATAVEPFFDHLFTNAESGALFLFIDNNAETFTEWMDGLAAKHGIETVRSTTSDARLPVSEQKVDLEPYCTKFEGYPKLTAQVACRVYRKP